ncbi:hypothetical protein [Streptomyces sp. NPDC001635]
MTTKIQLPPNLARHFYEARRGYLQSVGVTIAPWFQLTELERTVNELEIDLVRQAVEAAETEQAIRDQLQPGSPAAASQPLEDPASPAEEPTAAADDSRAEEPCGCLGCQVRRAIEALSEPPQPDAADAKGSNEEDCGHPICRAIRANLGDLTQPKPDAVDASTNLSGATVTVVPLDLRAFGVPFTEEELTQLQETAKRSLQEGMPTLVTVGVDLAFLDQAVRDARIRSITERFIAGNVRDALKTQLGPLVQA